MNRSNTFGEGPYGFSSRFIRTGLGLLAVERRVNKVLPINGTATHPKIAAPLV